jgi:hypothetical protein
MTVIVNNNLAVRPGQRVPTFRKARALLMESRAEAKLTIGVFVPRVTQIRKAARVPHKCHGVLFPPRFACVLRTRLPSS